MTITPAQLRSDFPEFADAAKYPDALVNLWITVGGRLILDSVWLDMTDTATEFFVAHQLSVARRNQLQAANGGIPGAVQGLLTSKSVDKAAAGYDVSRIGFDNAGYYNATNYGIQFFQLAMMFGAQGATQL